MDETETVIGDIQSRLLRGLVWRETLTEGDGVLDVFWLELRNGRGESMLLNLRQLPDVSSVMAQALDCIREYADAEIRGNLAQLLTALRAAEMPRTH